MGPLLAARPPEMQWYRWAPAFGFLLSLECFGQTAHAQATARASVDLPIVMRQGERWLISVAGERRDGATHGGSLGSEKERPPGVPGQFYPVPTFALVARNWSGAFTIAGNGATVMDAVRPMRSTRMMMGRVGLPMAGVTPFAHAGIGLWRMDPDAIALTVNDTEYALTLGTGLELSMGHNRAVGIETDYTTFHREGHGPQYLPFMQVVSAFIAMKAEF